MIPAATISTNAFGRSSPLCPFCRRHQIIAQPPARVVTGETRSLRSPRAIDLSIRLLPRCAIAQARDRVVVRPHALTLAARLQRRVDVGNHWHGLAIGQHANHRVGLTLQLNGLPNRAASIGECFPPQSITQDCGLGCARHVFRLCEVAPSEWAYAQHVKIVRGDSALMHKSRMVSGLQIHSRCFARYSGDQRRHIVPQQLPSLAIQGASPIKGLSSNGARIEGAHSFRLRIGQALQHQRIHNRKNRRVSSD